MSLFILLNSKVASELATNYWYLKGGNDNPHLFPTFDVKAHKSSQETFDTQKHAFRVQWKFFPSSNWLVWLLIDKLNLLINDKVYQFIDCWQTFVRLYVKFLHIWFIISSLIIWGRGKWVKIELFLRQKSS